MNNNKGFSLPVSKQIVLTALAFGIAAALIIISGLLIPIYGETINADPRELFVTLGSALTGPVGGIIIGFMSQTWNSGGSFQYISLILHVTGGLWMGFAYKKLVYEKIKYPMQLLGWAGLMLVYYFIFLFLGLIGWSLLFFPELYQEIFSGMTFWQAYLVIAQAAAPEFVVTTILTAIILAILPPKYRRPLW